MSNDHTTIKQLAGQVNALSRREDFAHKRVRWAEHNELVGDKSPLLWICPDEDGGWRNLVPPGRLVCADPDLRLLEWQLRKLIFHAEHLDDDFVVEPTVRFDIPGEYTGYLYGSQTQRSAWGIEITPLAVGSQAYHLPNYLASEENRERLLRHEVDFIPDEERWALLRRKFTEAADGEVDIRFTVPYSALVQSLLIELVHLYGLQELMMDLIDEPERIHAIMAHLSASKARLLGSLEARRLLFDNRVNVYTGSGGLGYTRAEPVADADARISQMWGFADAQEFSNVSLSMFEEFALPYQARGLSRFGMACYGCCEPLDDKFESIFRALPNLRRLSVSPWSDIRRAADAIGDRAIYSWKPNPAYVSPDFHEEEAAARLGAWRAATRDRCFTEVILKDLRTSTLDSLQRYIQLYKAAVSE